MTQEDKDKFDGLAESAYLFRVTLLNRGFDIAPLVLANNVIWHLYHEKTIVGTITFRHDEDEDFTYTNFRLYKYFKERFPKCKDFIMSEYYDYDEGSKVKYNFDKFDKYIGKIEECISQIEPTASEAVKVDSVSDSIARLREFCDEFDGDFSNNPIFKDVKVLIDENERLNVEMKKRTERIMNAFLRV